MSDRELLEAAARAAGVPRSVGGDLWSDARGLPWNPLTDDGDALRLAVKLRIDICFAGDFLFTQTTVAPTPMFKQSNDGDPYAATRRAIVRAAAAMEPSSVQVPSDLPEDNYYKEQAEAFYGNKSGEKT